MLDSDEVEERLRWALGKLPRWAVRVDAGGMWVAVSPTYELDGLVIHGRSAEELVHRVQVQVCVEALALDRAGRRPPGGVLCGVDFTGLVAEPPAEPEADQFTIRTEGQPHMPVAVPLDEFLARPRGGPVVARAPDALQKLPVAPGVLAEGAVEMFKRPDGSWWSTLADPWPVFMGKIKALMERNANGFLLTWSATERTPSRGGIVPPGMPSPLPTWGDPPPSVLGPAQAAKILRLVPNVDLPPPKPVIPQGRAFGFEGDPCPECGLMAMVRNGSCLKCTSCGATSGCS